MSPYIITILVLVTFCDKALLRHRWAAFSTPQTRGISSSARQKGALLRDLGYEIHSQTYGQRGFGAVALQGGAYAQARPRSACTFGFGPSAMAA